jgi:hypothetical protein
MKKARWNHCFLFFVHDEESRKEKRGAKLKMMRIVRGALLAGVLAGMFASCVSAAEIKLPDPQKSGGMGLFEALRKRSSAPGGDFPSGALSDEELSTVLWAASGLNRGKGWTVPMANGYPPYCKVYVLDDRGVFLYDWSEHALKEISNENIKGSVGMQGFVKNAGTILAFVASGKDLESFDEERAKLFSAVLVGAMTQDAYLAAAALDLGARYIHSIHRRALTEKLNLEQGDEPICIFLLGR